MMFGVGRHIMLIVSILFKTSIFHRIGKKNNQTLVSDADPEIPTLGSTIMPEMRFTEFPALSVYPRVGISLSASETDVRFYLSQI